MAEDEAVSIYRELSRIPSLTAAQILETSEGFVTVSSTWSQKDLERISTFKFKRTYLIKKGEASFETVIPVPDATELHEELLSSFSPCGKFQAIVRQIKNKKGEDQQYLEIWNKQSKVQNVNLTVVDKHGKVYKDDEFGCLNWSSDSRRIVYIAEKKQPKTVSYFEKKADQADKESDSSKDPIKGDQYLFQDNWGETLVDKCFSVICMYDVITEAVTVLEGVPEDLSPAQASWGPNDAGIVFSALYNEPYKLGAVYCDNRRSAIFHLILESKQCDTLSAVDKCCRAPRCSPDRSKLVYLQNDVGGPHQHCKQLMMYDWTTQTSSVVVDVIGKPKDSHSFPGLFLNNLPLRCWSGDNQSVFLHTLWRARQHILAINISTRKETLLTIDDFYPESTVLDVAGTTLLAKRAAPNKSGQMVVCDTSKVTEGIDWFVLEGNLAEFEDISWKHFSLPQPDGFEVEGVLFAPSASIGREQQPPLVVFPHGGPHSSFTSTYLILPAFLCKLNYVVLCVNYRGSTGYGQDAIFSLPGKVGTQDVSDVHLMSTHVLEEGYGDPAKVLVTGGSHGGFLSLHMIGQYPDFYKVCAVRNPVCNIANMLGSTDIPDWCFVEAGVEFSYDFVPSSSMYQKMLQKSPVVHIEKVKAPTLLLIGKDDLRVPPKQGELYYKTLRARNIKTKLLFYPDNNHGLVKVEAESDCLLNIHRWFQENL